MQSNNFIITVAILWAVCLVAFGVVSYEAQKDIDRQKSESSQTR